MRRPRKAIYVALAGVLLGAIVTPTALAGTAGKFQATGSANVTKQIKKLKRQVNGFNGGWRACRSRAGPPGPPGPRGAEGPATGPAGGDLTGTYPHPTLGPDAVGAAEILDGEVGGPELADNSVGADEIRGSAIVNGKIATAAVTSAELLNGTIQTEDMRFLSVGSFQLKDRTAVVGAGVAVNADVPRSAEVTCPPGQAVIGGGFARQDDEANSIIFSAPSETSPDRKWVVRGVVDAGSNTLYAWANCLAS